MQNKCYLCENSQLSVIHNGVRGNPNTKVLKCANCGLVQLDCLMENPDLFYKNSGMRKQQDIDIKSIRVTAEPDDNRRYQMIKEYIANKTVLDFGCGAGGFLHRAKNVCKKVSGIELESTMCKLLNSEGIKCYESLNDAITSVQDKFDVITFFHVIEHLPDPINILGGGVRELLTNNGKIIIEVPNCDDALLSLYKSEAFADFTYWECHLFLYNNETLKNMVKKAGYKVNFIKQIQRYSLSNTLYWLSNKKPGGHVQWNMMNDDILNKNYGNLLSRLGIADTIIAQIEPAK